ncbi:MAG: glycosyltransferase [Blastocatellia bacterium]|nr:glycosyltransferase [Blastocatellia bacterium]MCS7156512.1 glycosyltransferase [Blastocatellia bacterium]MCX7751747.1 glycosyltransferase [Blastocatellia bacterium]MDW8256432.1 glycosyltransferase [Acidobacteriota bacterium]
MNEGQQARPEAAVLVPTYRRPAYLERCLRSLLHQTHRPRCIVVVVRDDDEASHAVVRRFQEAIAERREGASPTGRSDGIRDLLGSPVEIHAVSVALPGPVWAFKRGIEALRARTDVELVFVTDDDAEAEPEWIERGSRHFVDPTVGIVAGRIIPYKNGHPVDLPAPKRVGVLSWYGRYVGGFERPEETHVLRSVAGFQGANAVIRREILERIEVDPRFIGYGVQFELDIALQVRRLGYRILFDPECRVRHFEAPRAIPEEARGDLKQLIYSYSHNHTYLMLKHLPWLGKLAFLLYFFVRGERRSLGLLTALWEAMRTPRQSWGEQLRLSLAGKWQGLRTYWQARRALRRSDDGNAACTGRRLIKTSC